MRGSRWDEGSAGAGSLSRAHEAGNRRGRVAPCAAGAPVRGACPWRQRVVAAVGRPAVTACPPGGAFWKTVHTGVRPRSRLR